MSSSITNDLTKWNDEQLRKNEDDKDKLFEKKSAEHGGRSGEAAKEKEALKGRNKEEVEVDESV
ncbi:hypothetical protein PAXRUDRAFT_15643 [Paxillus rubicundulus Ve08.2h10]|uniref:Uncharacterized protein n=1 Tax=Paxillus rubicundulus Ve08.2h10 TaxID=930991 RepID=A0A0D0CD76_9AGAM|nr:hypothetical protein PAXRUDRAFT_15643 [Paxillus rubicundulus Ve08.2h10]